MIRVTAILNLEVTIFSTPNQNNDLTFCNYAERIHLLKILVS